MSRLREHDECEWIGQTSEVGKGRGCLIYGVKVCKWRKESWGEWGLRKGRKVQGEIEGRIGWLGWLVIGVALAWVLKLAWVWITGVYGGGAVDHVMH